MNWNKLKYLEISRKFNLKIIIFASQYIFFFFCHRLYLLYQKKHFNRNNPNNMNPRDRDTVVEPAELIKIRF